MCVCCVYVFFPPVILIIVTVISVMTWLCIYCVGLAYDVSFR